MPCCEQTSMYYRVQLWHPHVCTEYSTVLVCCPLAPHQFHINLQQRLKKKKRKKKKRKESFRMSRTPKKLWALFKRKASASSMFPFFFHILSPYPYSHSALYLSLQRLFSVLQTHHNTILTKNYHIKNNNHNNGRSITRNRPESPGNRPR